MYILITTILLFIVFTTIALLYVRHLNHFKKEILPKQTLVVRALLETLSSLQIKLTANTALDSESPQVLSLIDIANFIEGRYRYASEYYDQYKVVFKENKNNLIETDMYLSNPDLPPIIKEELQHFKNSSCKSLVPPGSYFIVEALTLYEPAIHQNGLCCGDGEAFQNWLTFKESIDNLQFIVYQWLEEKAGINRHSLETSLLR